MLLARFCPVGALLCGAACAAGSTPDAGAMDTVPSPADDDDDPAPSDDGPSCGDAVAQPGEDCDGPDLGGATCESLGWESGRLTCGDDCRFDLAGCSRCGNGQLDVGEACDGTAFADADDCGDLGLGSSDQALACTENCQLDTGGCGGCGDGVILLPEECEPAAANDEKDNLGGIDCQALGWGGGALACRDDCRFDQSACETCGDHERTGGEACDGADLGGATCADFSAADGEPFDSGELACTETCTLDPAGCMRCGDEAITGTEVCDHLLLGEQTCESLGHTAGTLACSDSCDGYDESACTDCGDGVAEGDEACDGEDLLEETCEGLGFLGGGSLGCAPTCTFDTSNCSDNTCGDGVLQGTDVCDCGDTGSPCTSEQLGDHTCEDIEVQEGGGTYEGGDLACQSPGNCTAFDTSACFYCGDGEVNAGEACDGANLGGETCVSLGHAEGTLKCSSGCEFDESECSDVPNPFRECFTTETDVVDSGLVTTTLTLSAELEIGSLVAELAIDHSYVGDLHVTLRHGDVSVDLLDRVGYPELGIGGCDQPDIDVTLSDAASADAQAACAAMSPAVGGQLRPAEPLAAFAGESSLGPWYLDVRDAYPNDTGTVRRWCLEISW
ncbi:MAG: hypothetical protein B7733_08285 [Myxococcales bacterium FL481]|nr:MAG: hypothetical protein B7733_08285 [Myxococcales bacterium FL481]